MLGAGVMLSACSPVQMGAAAIVGNQRISQSTLAANVTELQSGIAKYPAQELQISSAQAPKVTLNLMLEFALWNRIAKDAGVTASPAQVEDAVTRLKQSAQQSAKKQGGTAEVLLLDNGLTPRTLPGYARALVEQGALEQKFNGGKPVSSRAEQTKVSAQMTRLQEQGIKELDIKVNPQYGKFDPRQGVVAAPDLLSKPVASAAGGAPAAS